MTQYADLAAVDEMGRHTHQMIMVPRLWTACTTVGETQTLTWAVFPFKESSRAQIPEAPGIYAFLIAPGICGNLNVSYLMYVGETERTLRDRFSDYLLEAKSDKIRPKLLRILPLYPEHLMFACATLPNGVAPKDIEAALLEAYLPPGNDRVPATVGRARRAFQ